MTLSWLPVIWVDILGSALTLMLALMCVKLAWQVTRRQPGDTFRYYLFLLCLSFAIFAVSRSFGHLVKQILIFAGLTPIWQKIAPFSGSINSATFIIAFAFSLYFYRSYQVHLELELHKNRLEELVAERTAALANKNLELQDALAKVKVLSGFLPICASCKKIRDDDGYWNQIEEYIQTRSEAEFSHSICPECAEKLYPELFNKNKKEHDP